MTVKSDSQMERLFAFGRPLSPLYAFLMACRSYLYGKGILKQHKLDVPVISVGNLVLGGTGKTPLVYYIARLLQQHGRKPAILSRGYKGSAAGEINVVSDTTNILLTAAEAGDEPRLLAEKLPGIPVITGKKRFLTGRYAMDFFGADALILDDGFQHLALKRDLDLVLFSGHKLLGNNRVLPGGELREPPAALERAGAFIISTSEEPPDREVQAFIGQLKMLYPEKPVFSGIYQPEEMLTRLHDGKHDSVSQAAARSMVLYGFCGIAGPESFKKILATTGISLSGFRAFADHHAYTADDVSLLLENAENSGAAGLITTEKDLVKLHTLLPRAYPLLALPVTLRLGADFDRFLLARLEIT